MHPGIQRYKTTRIFYPAQIAALPSRDIEEFQSIGITPAMMDEFLIYVATPVAEYGTVDGKALDKFWCAQKTRFPAIAEATLESICFSFSSVDVERSFSQYKTMMTDKRESMTEVTTKQWVMLMYNGDIEGHFGGSVTLTLYICVWGHSCFKAVT